MAKKDEAVKAQSSVPGDPRRDKTARNTVKTKPGHNHFWNSFGEDPDALRVNRHGRSLRHNLGS